jgi:hypothetical protein
MGLMMNALMGCSCGARSEAQLDFTCAHGSNEEVEGSDSDNDTDDASSDGAIGYVDAKIVIEAEEKDWRPVVSRRAFEALLGKDPDAVCFSIPDISPIVYALWEAFMVDLLDASSTFTLHASRTVLESSDVNAALRTRFGLSLP